MIARVRVADPGMFALKNALRAAVVVPLAFALALGIEAKQMALFAAFGSISLLVFVDFGGPRRARLRAYLLLLAAGASLIALGTLCSRSVWLATASTGLVAFAIFFAGVLDDYVAAARAAAMLTFVLPVMLPAGAAAIPWRVAGWGLAGALCTAATLLVWPERPRDALRHGAAEAARSLAGLATARSRGDRVGGDAAAQASRAATVEVRERFVSMAQRPSGTAGRTAALARLIADLGWLCRVANRVPALAGAGFAPCAEERAEVEAAAPAALLAVASRLDGGSSGAALDLARLERAHDAFGRAQLAHFEAMQPHRDEAEAAVELDQAYRLLELSLGTLRASRDALQAAEEGPDPPSTETARARIAATRRLARVHASTSSVWLRNSVRGAVGLALAVLVAQLTDLQHGFWIVLGTMSVLRSSAVSTSATIASALLGTLAGIVLGGLLVFALGSDRTALWVVLPFAVMLAAYAPQAISFAAGQAAFTLVVLVLFNLIEPVGWKVGLVRVEDVAAGAGVSLLVGLLFWPRGATAIVHRAIGAAYAGAAHYLDATVTALLGGGRSGQAGTAADEAFDTAQLLDTALRDYIANRSSASGRLHDLSLLATGAGRVRRVAGLLQNAQELGRLRPIGDELPRLARARDAFDAERHARCDWYASFGAAISDSAPSPEPEPGLAGGDTDAPAGQVVLERTASGRGLQPGLAIAWAQRHLDLLAELEPALASAYGRVIDGVTGDVDRGDPLGQEKPVGVPAARIQSAQ